MRYCTIKDCKNKHKAKGLCSSHYQSGQTPEYNLWSKIKQRCYNANNISYQNYGGRGIKMANEWYNSFNSFYSYIGKRPSSRHSLDRIDNNGNYEPGNVRWATIHEQCANKRTNNKDVGVSFSKQRNRWVSKITYNKRNITKDFVIYDDAVKYRKQCEIDFL